MADRLSLGLELQPVAEVAADQLFEPLDLALQVPSNLFLDAQRKRFLAGRDPVPLQHPLAKREHLVERAAVREVAAELALAVPVMRARHIFANRLGRALQQS